MRLRAESTRRLPLPSRHSSRSCHCIRRRGCSRRYRPGGALDRCLASSSSRISRSRGTCRTGRSRSPRDRARRICRRRLRPLPSPRPGRVRGDESRLRASVRRSRCCSFGRRIHRPAPTLSYTPSAWFHRHRGRRPHRSTAPHYICRTVLVHSSELRLPFHNFLRPRRVQRRSSILPIAVERHRANGPRRCSRTSGRRIRRPGYSLSCMSLALGSRPRSHRFRHRVPPARNDRRSPPGRFSPVLGCTRLLAGRGSGLARPLSRTKPAPKRIGSTA
jgi:hypothetical protein